MPTIRIPDTSVSATASGDLTMATDSHGSIITWTGSLTLNGEHVESPRQLRASWAMSGSDYMEDADAADVSEPGHWRARARTVAYATAIQVLDGTTNPAETLAALREAHRIGVTDARKQATDDLQRVYVETLDTALIRIEQRLERAARYEWIG